MRPPLWQATPLVTKTAPAWAARWMKLRSMLRRLAKVNSSNLLPMSFSWRR